MSPVDKYTNIEAVLPLLKKNRSKNQLSSDLILLLVCCSLFLAVVILIMAMFFGTDGLAFYIVVSLVVSTAMVLGYQVYKKISDKKSETDFGFMDGNIDDLGLLPGLEKNEKEKYDSLCQLLEQLPSPVFFINEDDHISFLNIEARKILGLGKRNLKNLNYQDVFGSDGILIRQEKRSSQKFEQKSIDLPSSFTGAEGRRLVLLNLPTLPSPSTLQFSALNVNDLSHIFEGAPIAIATISGKGNLTEFNHSFSKIYKDQTGYKPNIGSPFNSFLEEGQWGEVADRIKNVVGGDPSLFPMDLDITGEGSLVLQAFFGTGTSDGMPSATVFLIDTTDQKRLEVQFVQSQKMQAVGQLAGGVAHDFNNLLTAIIGFSDLLLDRHGPGDPSFSDLMQVKQNANRAANLVRQLLAFSRRQTLRPTVLDVTDVLSELLELIRRLIGENIELEVKHGRRLGRVKVDQGQLEQVVINLAVNARDAMLDGGKLSIKTYNISKEESEKLNNPLLSPADFVCISVSDTGSGIPKEYRDKVFEPFFTTKDVGKGTGLGLSTVYGIVKQTGGFIFIDGEEGEGVTFNVYLPLFIEDKNETIEQPVISEERVRRDISGRGRIMVVEDEDAVRMFATRALTKKGYTVLEADCGEKALEILDQESEPIDLMISDVVMPAMDGTALAEKVLEKYPGTKIILISGYAEEAFRKKMEPGKFSFLPKPFSLIQLGEQVKEALGDSKKSKKK